MRNLLTGLDVGTSKVCALVADASPEGEFALLGHGVAPCTGLRKGVVVNIEATVAAIRAALDEAEKTSGARVGSVVAGVAGPHIRGLNSHGIVAVRGGEVGTRDVERVIDAARAVARCSISCRSNLRSTTRKACASRSGWPGSGSRLVSISSPPRRVTGRI